MFGYTKSTVCEKRLVIIIQFGMIKYVCAKRYFWNKSITLWKTGSKLALIMVRFFVITILNKNFRDRLYHSKEVCSGTKSTKYQHTVMRTGTAEGILVRTQEGSPESSNGIALFCIFSSLSTVLGPL